MPKKRATYCLPALLIPSWISEALWRKFEAMRQEIGWPLSEDAAELAVKRLDEFRKQGYAPDGLIEDAIVGRWRGIFVSADRQRELRDRKRAQAAGGNGVDSSSAWLRFRAAIRDERVPADDAITKRIIAELGGMTRLGTMESRQIEFAIRKDFDALYRRLTGH